MQNRPYSQQEDDFYKFLTIKPDATNEFLETAYRLFHNQAPTYSAMARARQRLGLAKQHTESDKQLYMRAWWTLYPDGNKTSLHGKLLAIFEQDTRGDQLDEWREVAKNHPHPNPQEVIDRYEQHISTKHRTLGLEEN
jgi:hypothetical protein